MSRVGEGIGANLYIYKTPIVVGVAGALYLAANKKRVAYRVFNDPANEDTMLLDYDANISQTSTLIIIWPGKYWEDTGFDTCYKGPIYLLSGSADQEGFIEEVVTQ